MRAPKKKKQKTDEHSNRISTGAALNEYTNDIDAYNVHNSEALWMHIKHGGAE